MSTILQGGLWGYTLTFENEEAPHKMRDRLCVPATFYLSKEDAFRNCLEDFKEQIIGGMATEEEALDFQWPEFEYYADNGDLGWGGFDGWTTDAGRELLGYAVAFRVYQIGVVTEHGPLPEEAGQTMVGEIYEGGKRYELAVDLWESATEWEKRQIWADHEAMQAEYDVEDARIEAEEAAKPTE